MEKIKEDLYIESNKNVWKHEKDLNRLKMYARIKVMSDR